MCPAMANEILMPKLGMTMEKGTIIKWFKEEGETVAAGEPLLEVLTDKINIEVESYVSGTLLKRYYGENEEVPVNRIIGYIGQSGEAVPDTPPDAEPSEAAGGGADAGETAEQIREEAPGTGPNKVRATPAARRVAREYGVSLEQVRGSGENGTIHRDDVLKHVAERSPADDAAVRATPLARKIAERERIDLSGVKGTGIHGKITKNDLPLPASAGNDREPSAAPSAPAIRKLEGMRKIIAQRMAQNAFTAPHVTLHSEIDMTEAVQLRQKLLGPVEQKTGWRLSYTEMIVKAAALMLRKHPNVNASIAGEEIVYHSEANVGLAVALEDGLIVPVIRNADRKSLADLTAECKSLAKSAKEGKLSPDQLTGGTFTISNLGMYAVDAFTPIINLPEAAILGVGRIQEKPVVKDGKIEIRAMMHVSLSFDHRIIDGAPAASFLTDLKHVLEHPYEMLI
jgi:pyruvate dehydrogenase E2 component (dihydrolipoamide acetyltransferase)